jgi:hypothetical protein
MNYDVTAKKIVTDARNACDETSMEASIAAALRRAANEAAWDGYDYGRKAGRALTWEELITPELDTEKNYGSRPKVGTP